MTIDAAVIKEQGVTFAVVVVNSSAVSSQEAIRNAQLNFSKYFPNMPIILMKQNSRGIPTYYGRKDIVQFLSKVHYSRLPFKRYTV